MALLSLDLVTLTTAIAAADDAAQAAATELIPVAIEPQTHTDGTWYATRYHAAQQDCAVAWIAYYNEPGVVKYVSDCSAPLAEQLPLLSAICSTFLANDRNAGTFRTLFWGRLAPDSKAVSREMSLRLAAAAFASAGWDKARGRPQQGDINGFVRDLANQALIYPELTALFAPFHLTVLLRTVEKVLVAPAGELPFYPELQKIGVRPADRLPFDGMAWFVVNAEAQH